ncbi:twitching motility protein PilT [Gemmatimonadetes bacterium T265]|nr:twitching motility protein PilT [Gemmatimonadetes bacterium T265]
MDAILRAAVERGASDLHVKAGDVLRARVDGRLVPLTRQPLTAEQTRSIAQRLLPGEAERATLDALTDYDCAYAVAGVGRFRVNIMRQRGAFSAVLRLIPHEVPTLDVLGLPASVARIAEAERGMVLVTGVTGSGKSSTLAAMIRHVNARCEKHILTLENPVEFLHADLKGSVTQREVGVDTESFRSGLRAALRQDPDVILIGEMRDAETVDTALKAAETGHLLLSTLHTPDAQSTVLRTVAMFAAAEQAVVRMRLAESLHAVVSQRLLPRASGKGRVVAAEIMVVTPAIRDLVVEGRVGEVRELIEEGQQYGMQTFDQHLAELVRGGAVAYDVALAAATRPADFALQFRMLHAAGVPAAGGAVSGPTPSGVVAPAAAPVVAGAGAPSVAGLPAAGAFDFLHG